MDRDELREIISEYMYELIGDTPVPYQLDAALCSKANEDEQKILRDRINTLEKDVKRLIELIGDTAVAEQINTALNG